MTELKEKSPVADTGWDWGSPDQHRKQVFTLLKRKGPLCSSQIGFELGLPIRYVVTALNDLEKDSVVQQRPDRDEALRDVDDTQIPWGLPPLFKWPRSR